MTTSSLNFRLAIAFLAFSFLFTVWVQFFTNSKLNSSFTFQIYLKIMLPPPSPLWSPSIAFKQGRICFVISILLSDLVSFFANCSKILVTIFSRAFIIYLDIILHLFVPMYKLCSSCYFFGSMLCFTDEQVCRRVWSLSRFMEFICLCTCGRGFFIPIIPSTQWFTLLDVQMICIITCYNSCL